MPRVTLLGLLRTGLVLAGALATATLLPRAGLPPAFVPDLVVIVVASSAVLRGPTHGALLGLGGGWVVDLMPPAGSPLGLTALLYAGAGMLAGTCHREGGRSLVVPVAGVALAASAVELGGVVVAVLGGGVADLPTASTRVATTVALGLLALPVLVRLDRALVRRRLA